MRLRSTMTPLGACMKNQSGITLIIALIVLVAMSLAGIALVRSVDTGVMVAGNLAFRQGATVAGDAGIEAARTWLLNNNSSLLENDVPSNGYYATQQFTQEKPNNDPNNDVDLTGNSTANNTNNDVDWENKGIGIASAKCLAMDTAGNTTCYIIHRMCNALGPLDASKCSTRQSIKTGSSLGALRQMVTYQEGKWPDFANQAYYRVTVRIAGPRNNISFIQTFLLI